MLVDEMKNLRSGEVCAMAGVEPGTMRSWVNVYGLPLGDRSRAGYPRYSLEDVVKLRLVNRLRDPFFRLPLRAAIGFVLFLGAEIDREVEAHLAEGTHYRPNGAGRRQLVAQYFYIDDEFRFDRVVTTERGGGALHGDGFQTIADPLGIRVHVDVTEHIQKSIFTYEHDLKGVEV